MVAKARDLQVVQSDRRSVTLGDTDPRDRRGGLASRQAGSYQLPLKVDGSGRLLLDLGPGLRVVGGKLTIDMDYVLSRIPTQTNDGA